MQGLIVSIWILQGVAMFFDEFYFHHKRGLKKWESLGHPIDTLFFLLCFIYTLIASKESILGFIILSFVSTIFITKDEFIHAKECDGAENWLHSMLFIIHPLSLIALYYAWQKGFENIILIQSLIIFAFGLYQLIYWNFVRKIWKNN